MKSLAVNSQGMYIVGANSDKKTPTLPSQSKYDEVALSRLNMPESYHHIMCFE